MSTISQLKHMLAHPHTVYLPLFIFQKSSLRILYIVKKLRSDNSDNEISTISQQSTSQHISKLYFYRSSCNALHHKQIKGGAHDSPNLPLTNSINRRISTV
jgi:hypothetical protein